MQIPEKECLKLKYEFNPGLREGAGGYEEKWERVKIHNQQESIEAMSALVRKNAVAGPLSGNMYFPEYAIVWRSSDLTLYA